MGLVLTNYGVFSVSGASLKTVVDAITPLNAVSGAGLYFIPVGNGMQINLIGVNAL